MIFNHIGIVVSNLAKSIDFYCSTLGSTVVGRWHNDELQAVNLQCAGLTIELLEYANFAPTHKSADGLNHLAFTIEDIAAQIERLTQLGVDLETTSPKIISEHKKIIFFHGPDGERIELVEES